MAQLPKSKDASRYEDLARRAREAGYARVTRFAVQSWVKHGLLPHVVVTPTGFGSRAITEPAGIQRQLLALCHLRYDPPATRSLWRLALDLWLDGYAVADRAVRTGLLNVADLPGRVEGATRVPGDEGGSVIWDVVDRLVYEEHLLGGEQVRRQDLAAGLGDFLAVQAGQAGPDEMALGGLAALEQLSGASSLLAAISAAGERPIGLRATMTHLTVEHIRSAVNAASWAELEAARLRAREIRDEIAMAAAEAAARGDPGYAGLDVLSRELATREGEAFRVVALVAVPEAAAAPADSHLRPT